MSSAGRILLVDDDPVEAESFDKSLSDKGYAVVTVPNGEDALWRLGDDKFDVVITCLMLRGMSGLEVAEEIQSSQPWLPVVVIAGHGSEAAQARAGAVGVAEFLHKPLSPGQLAEAADRALQSTKSVAAPQPSTSQAKVVPRQAMIRFSLRLRDIVLFLLAPFIGLVYLLTLPIIGLGALAWFAFKSREPVSEKAEVPRPAAMAGPGLLNSIGMIFAVVICGVAYAVFAPILGIALILWAGFQAWGKLGARALRA